MLARSGAAGVICLCLLAAPAQADWWPEGWYDQDAPGSYPDIDRLELPFFWDTAEPLEVLSVALIRFHQTRLSATRSGRCPFWPSCSRYGLRAIADHGPYWGWLMTLDRLLFRENMAIFVNYPRIDRAGERLVIDHPRYSYLFEKLPWPLLREGDGHEW